MGTLTAMNNQQVERSRTTQGTVALRGPMDMPRSRAERRVTGTRSSVFAARSRWSVARSGSVWFAVVACAAVGGCSRDVRLSGKKLRSPVVREAFHYGVKLDQQASPEQVTYVLLRAIRDDVNAASAQAREEALDIQFDVCAADELARRNKTRLARDEFIYHAVNSWAPTLSHYAGSFPTSLDDAKARFVRREGKLGSDAKPTAGTAVLLEVEDPSRNANANAVVSVLLIQDGGFWRVIEVGFVHGKRSIDKSATASATPSAPPAKNGG